MACLSFRAFEPHFVLRKDTSILGKIQNFRRFLSFQPHFFDENLDN